MGVGYGACRFFPLPQRDQDRRRDPSSITIGRRPDLICGIVVHRGVELSGLVCQSGWRSAHLARFGGRLSASRLSSGIKGASFVIPSICSAAPTPARLTVFCAVPSPKDMLLIGLAGLLLL